MNKLVFSDNKVTIGKPLITPFNKIFNFKGEHFSTTVN